MSEAFDAFNEQVKTDTEPELTEKPTGDQAKEGSDRGEQIEDSSYETQPRDIEVVGENDDRLRVSAETEDGTQVDREISTDRAGKIMSFLGVTDARNLEDQTVIVWEDETGESHLEFQTPM
jgi:hypothetical protein